MSLSEKLSKLLRTKDDENVKLATNIIIAQVKDSNVIAMLCILKQNKRFDILESEQVVGAVNKVLETKISNDLIKSKVNYGMPHLLRWALQFFKSQENIEVARNTYLLYINHLTDTALEELKISEGDDELVASVLGDKDELPAPAPPPSPPKDEQDDLPF